MDEQCSVLYPVMMNPFKLKRLKSLSEQLVAVNKPLAAEIAALVYAIENKPHLGPRRISEDLGSAVSRVAGAMGDVEFCLIGGLAVQYWVQVRKTDDVDLVVLGEDLGKVKAAFPGGHEILYGYSFVAEGTHVDVLGANHFAWAAEAIRKADAQDFLGAKIRIALPEYLILFKMVSMRDRDVSDILALLTLNGVPKKAMELVEKYSPTSLEDLSQMIQMAELGQI